MLWSCLLADRKNLMYVHYAAQLTTITEYCVVQLTGADAYHEVLLCCLLWPFMKCEWLPHSASDDHHWVVKVQCVPPPTLTPAQCNCCVVCSTGDDQKELQLWPGQACPWMLVCTCFHGQTCSEHILHASYGHQKAALGHQKAAFGHWTVAFVNPGSYSGLCIPRGQPLFTDWIQ